MAFTFASPKMDLALFTRTPQGPTPGIADVFTRGSANFELKTNNEELDNIVSQMRKNIARNNR